MTSWVPTPPSHHLGLRFQLQLPTDVDNWECRWQNKSTTYRTRFLSGCPMVTLFSSAGLSIRNPLEAAAIPPSLFLVSWLGSLPLLRNRCKKHFWRPHTQSSCREPRRSPTPCGEPCTCSSLQCLAKSHKRSEGLQGSSRATNTPECIPDADAGWTGGSVTKPAHLEVSLRTGGVDFNGHPPVHRVAQATLYRPPQ